MRRSFNYPEEDSVSSNDRPNRITTPPLMDDHQEVQSNSKGIRKLAPHNTINFSRNNIGETRQDDDDYETDSTFSDVRKDSARAPAVPEGVRRMTVPPEVAQQMYEFNMNNNHRPSHGKHHDSGDMTTTSSGTDCCQSNNNHHAGGSTNFSMNNQAGKEGETDCGKVCEQTANTLPYNAGITPVYLPSPFSVPYEALGSMVTCGPRAKFFQPKKQPDDGSTDLYSPHNPDGPMNPNHAQHNKAGGGPPARVQRMPPPAAGQAGGAGGDKNCETSGAPGICKKCQIVPYRLGYNVIDLRPSDEQLQMQVMNLDSLEQSVSLNTGASGNNSNSAGAGGSLSDFGLSPNSAGIARQVLDLLDQRFEGVVRLGQDTHQNLNIYGYQWEKPEDRRLFGQFLVQLCGEVRPILLAEPRLVRVESPCYVLGDIHGNYKDLKIFERMFWRFGPRLCPAKILFIGDYVDRGQYGPEVVAYLFAQKILAPKNIFMLRGNHEDRFINGHAQYQFKAQCYALFGQDLGQTVFEVVNDTFDCLPMAATIDNSIFCVHGGIPCFRPTEAPKSDEPVEGTSAAFNGTIDSLNDAIPAPLGSVESNATALQLLWNDPLPPKGTQDPRLNKELESFKDGFCANLARTGGSIATDYPIKYFSTYALQDFLKRNNLNYLIRAHEVAMRGFYLRKQFKVFHVFASNFYCGQRTNASVMYVNDQIIRQFKIDTTDTHVIEASNLSNEMIADQQKNTKYSYVPSCYPKLCSSES